jgi:hypothetical protein
MKTNSAVYSLAVQCGQEVRNVREPTASKFKQHISDITALDAFEQEDCVFQLVALNNQNLLARVSNCNLFHESQKGWIWTA